MNQHNDMLELAQTNPQSAMDELRKREKELTEKHNAERQELMTVMNRVQRLLD